MKGKLFFTVFLALVIGVTLWFLGKAFIEVSTYRSFSVKKMATIKNPQIFEKGKNLFGIEGEYEFEFEGKTYRGKSSLNGFFPNKFAAEKKLETWVNIKETPLWIDPKDPEKITFQKKFPYKTVVSAVILVGLSLYFYFLGRFANKGSG